ncbi:Lrp/AsnC family transcriptional regulator [Pseudomonas sp. OA65]|nr:Lrp/AsnC family transcriptional regulator [Pseudomonas sp. OA65]
MRFSRREYLPQKSERRKKHPPSHWRGAHLLLGFEVTAFVHLSVDSHTEEVTRKLEEKITLCPEVVALYNVTGDYDFLGKIVLKSIALYTAFIEKTLRKIPCIMQIRTSITLREVYDSRIIPLSTHT